jgi:hypothetical protein
MPKKSKRQSRSTSSGARQSKSSSRAKTQAKTTESPQVTRPASTPVFSVRSQRDDFNPDYTYIIKDLHRIGILAGSFLIVLIILSLIMPYILH